MEAMSLEDELEKNLREWSTGDSRSRVRAWDTESRSRSEGTRLAYPDWTTHKNAEKMLIYGPDYRSSSVAGIFGGSGGSRSPLLSPPRLLLGPSRPYDHIYNQQRASEPPYYFGHSLSRSSSQSSGFGDFTPPPIYVHTSPSPSIYSEPAGSFCGSFCGSFASPRPVSYPSATWHPPARSPPGGIFGSVKPRKGLRSQGSKTVARFVPVPPPAPYCYSDDETTEEEDDDESFSTSLTSQPKVRMNMSIKTSLKAEPRTRQLGTPVTLGEPERVNIVVNERSVLSKVLITLSLLLNLVLVLWFWFTLHRDQYSELKAELEKWLNWVYDWFCENHSRIFLDTRGQSQVTTGVLGMNNTEDYLYT